jgi:hypothetical protein
MRALALELNKIKIFRNTEILFSFESHNFHCRRNVEIETGGF